MVTCLYSYKAMCRLYNYGLCVYIQKAVWLQDYNAEGEEAMRPQSNIAIWQIYMATQRYGNKVMLHVCIAIGPYTLIALDYYTLYYIFYKIYSIFYTLCSTKYIIHCYGYWLWLLWLRFYTISSALDNIYVYIYICSILYSYMVICLPGYNAM